MNLQVADSPQRKIEHRGEPKELSPRYGLYVVIIVAFAFFASWWNRYVPPTADGETVLMTRWGMNALPYRDYFFQGPPGWPILVRAIVTIAGPHLLATLTFGAVLRTAAVCALYAMLLRIARPSYAALASLAALFVSSTDISDTPFYYNHLGTAFVLLGTYLSLRAAERDSISSRLAGVIGGALLAYAVTIKQTMIFGSAAACVA